MRIEPRQPPAKLDLLRAFEERGSKCKAFKQLGWSSGTAACQHVWDQLEDDGLVKRGKYWSITSDGYRYMEAAEQ